jgi:hypothetical protein
MVSGAPASCLALNKVTKSARLNDIGMSRQNVEPDRNRKEVGRGETNSIAARCTKSEVWINRH